MDLLALAIQAGHDGPVFVLSPNDAVERRSIASAFKLNIDTTTMTRQELVVAVRSALVKNLREGGFFENNPSLVALFQSPNNVTVAIKETNI